MIRAALLAVGVVLAASAAGSGDLDYELTLRTANESETVCVKTASACEVARRAVYSETWRPAGLESPIDASCAPRPGCFPWRSNCIEGYNCR